MINLVLFIIAVSLGVNLLTKDSLNLTGKSIYSWDQNLDQAVLKAEAKCVFNNQEEQFSLSPEQCCYQLLKQYACVGQGGELVSAAASLDLGFSSISETLLGIKCYTAEDSEQYFTLNKEMLDYCWSEGYDVKLE